MLEKLLLSLATCPTPAFSSPYLLPERGHVFPGVGFGVVSFHFPQFFVVVPSSHGVDVLSHHTDAEVRMLSLERLDLEPPIVAWVVPCKGRGWPICTALLAQVPGMDGDHRL